MIYIFLKINCSILLGGTRRASGVEGGRASVDSRFEHRLANTRGIGSDHKPDGQMRVVRLIIFIIILVNAAIHNTLEFNKHGKLGILGLL